jgi:hypothetical protein
MLILSTNLKYNRIHRIMQVSNWQSLKMIEKFSQVFYYPLNHISRNAHLVHQNWYRISFIF